MGDATVWELSQPQDYLSDSKDSGLGASFSRPEQVESLESELDVDVRSKVTGVGNK